MSIASVGIRASIWRPAGIPPTAQKFDLSPTLWETYNFDGSGGYDPLTKTWTMSATNGARLGLRTRGTWIADQNINPIGLWSWWIYEIYPPPAVSEFWNVAVGKRNAIGETRSFLPVGPLPPTSPPIQEKVWGGINTTLLSNCNQLYTNSGGGSTNTAPIHKVTLKAVWYMLALP